MLCLNTVTCICSQERHRAPEGPGVVATTLYVSKITALEAQWLTIAVTKTILWKIQVREHTVPW